MAEILNIAGLHNNGKAELIVGIRKNQFTFSRDNESNVVTLKDSITGELLTINNKDTYSKDEINTMLSGIMRYVGQCASFDLLKTAIPNPVRGMVVAITLPGGKDVDGVPIPAFSHLVYNGEGWKII